MRTVVQRAVTAGLTVAMAWGVIIPAAYATPADDLAAAEQRLNNLGAELASLQERLAAQTESLENTNYRIGETEARISETEDDLASARGTLAGRMRSSYKAGNTTFLDVILGASSIEDLISRIYYMDKVAADDAASIAAVQSLEATLNSQRDMLMAQRADEQAAVDALNDEVGDYESKVAEAQAYYEQLDAEIQAQLAAQAAEEAAAAATAIAAIEESAAIATATGGAAPAEAVAASTSAGGNVSTDAAQTDGTRNADAANAGAAAANTGADAANTTAGGNVSTSPNTNTTGSSSSTSGSGTYGGAGVASAYSCIGKPYVYGAAGPNGFDCSGLVCYCFGYRRGRTTYAMISSLQAEGRWRTSMSELAYGDLVFPSAGHVGIYIGNGMMIHAPTPGRSVCVAPVYAFYGGGTY